MTSYDTFSKGKHILSFLCSHFKAVIVGLAVIIVLFLISYWMTLQSIKYVPWNVLSGSDIQVNDLEIPYSKSASYSESVTLSSFAFDMAADLNGTISALSDIAGAASTLSDASGRSGTLFIPAGAAKVENPGMGIYGWSKRYKVLFNQIDCVDNELVLVLGNGMVSVTIGAGTGIHSEISVYQLK